MTTTGDSQKAGADASPVKTRRSIQRPRGTRDLYPSDLLRRRYLTQIWRDTAIRHGFDEIAGPTFEHAELYSIKSGEGILSELFQAFNGKDPEEVERIRAHGQAPRALRPEFTPTLARLYAAHAKQLPQPTKWFSIGPFFRAERPQRGRLHEFLQWNMDVLGGEAGAPETLYDAEIVASCVVALHGFGLSTDDARIKFNHRGYVTERLTSYGLQPADADEALQVLDRRGKASEAELRAALERLGITPDGIEYFSKPAGSVRMDLSAEQLKAMGADADLIRQKLQTPGVQYYEWNRQGLLPWSEFDTGVVRGLSYYTDIVFEAIAEGERAVAGGGRYNGLVELLGGPPTPGVGFAMGDVVLGLLLDDLGLMPEGAELMDAVSRPVAGVRPEAFVISADETLGDPHVSTLVARLRRGLESDAYLQRGDRKPWHADRYAAASGGLRPMHARLSYKSTRNLKKLLADAERQHARFAVVEHDEHKVQVKDLDRRAELVDRNHGDFSVHPAHPAFVGRALAHAIAHA